jgi:outer membrane protein OmpA-like peptidoglycan-associated protein
MMRRVAAFTLCSAVVVLASACATKTFVREQVGAAETKLSGRVDEQGTKLRETADRTAANTQALDAAGQRLQGLDARVGEASSLAAGAKKDAESVADRLRQTETEMTQRFANRNRYAELGTMSIYFHFNKAVLQDRSMTELDEIASALKADPNAVVELKGFADPRGTERYNFQLTRERVDAVVRYLVERHGIDLRRIHAVGMGKVVQAGEKPSKEAFARSRRVDIRLLAPQG